MIYQTKYMVQLKYFQKANINGGETITIVNVKFCKYEVVPALNSISAKYFDVCLAYFNEIFMCNMILDFNNKKK